jgi:hypothetical protein
MKHLQSNKTLTSHQILKKSRILINNSRQLLIIKLKLFLLNHSLTRGNPWDPSKIGCKDNPQKVRSLRKKLRHPSVTSL